MNKTREDYLLIYEERLFDQLKTVFAKENKSLLILYTLTAIYVLFESGLIGTITEICKLVRREFVLITLKNSALKVLVN